MEKNEYEEWVKSLDQMDMQHRQMAIRDKILESDQLTDEDRDVFKDSYDYLIRQTERGKPFEIRQFHIYLTEVKNHKQLSFEQFSRIMMLLTMCGFKFDLKKI